MNNDYPLVYLLIYKNLKERSRNVRIEVSTAAVIECVKRNLHCVSVSFIYAVLDEMESKYNLIRRINHQKYEILPSNKDKILNRYLNTF